MICLLLLIGSIYVVQNYDNDPDEIILIDDDLCPSSDKCNSGG